MVFFRSVRAGALAFVMCSVPAMAHAETLREALTSAYINNPAILSSLLNVEATAENIALAKGEMVEWVERFYGEYYFRPKAAWRIVRKGIFDGHERKRIYKEAKDYLSLRAKRKKYVADEKASVLSQADERA